MTKTGSMKFMTKTLGAAALAVGLIASPILMLNASAQSAAPAATTKSAAKTKKPPSPGQVAMRDRQKKCAAEWNAAKDAGKIEKGMKWPKFWSACNKRLKSSGGFF